MMDEYIRILQSGGVIAAPTDTVYGLLADATNFRAVERVYKVKGRVEDKPLPIFIHSIDALKDIVLVTEKQLTLLRTLWPGKITVVLPVKPNSLLAPNAISKDNTVASRIPNHPLILDILKQFKQPLTGTSANRSGMPPCLNAECLKRQLKQVKPDLIINRGNLPKSEPSTIVDLTKMPPQILRKGATWEKAKRVVSNSLQ